MSRHIDARQVRRWQEEVAREPGSTAFLPLAEVYRREGRLDVARRLCLRGLEQQPEHVEAHVLLGRIYRESGDAERACDELDIALRLDPEHRAARRALGYLLLERRAWADAVRHLEILAAGEPRDPRLVSALALARRHLAAAAAPPAAEVDAAGALGPALERFLREARARLVLLIEGSGRILARHGAARELDLAGVASLSAGIHSAAREMARLLGQPGFDQLCQGEGERQLFLGSLPAPEGELILVALFGTESNVGLVRVRFEEFVREAADLSWYAAPRSARPGAGAFDAELSHGLRRAQENSGALPLFR